MVKSNFTGKQYEPNKSCKILNMQQLAFYMANDVELLDLFVSKDYKTKKMKYNKQEEPKKQFFNCFFFYIWKYHKDYTSGF